MPWTWLRHLVIECIIDCIICWPLIRNISICKTVNWTRYNLAHGELFLNRLLSQNIVSEISDILWWFVPYNRGDQIFWVKMDYLKTTEDDKAYIIRTRGTNNDDLKRDVQILKDWLKRQPHLPQGVQGKFCAALLAWKKPVIAKTLIMFRS